jgi:hypothetical protein
LNVVKNTNAATGEHAASYKAGITKNNTGSKLQRESQQATHAASNNKEIFEARTSEPQG